MINGCGALFSDNEEKQRSYNPSEHRPLSDDQINMLKKITVWGDQANIVFGLLSTIDDLRQTKAKNINFKGSDYQNLQEAGN